MVDAVRRAHMNTIIAQVRRRGAGFEHPRAQPRHVRDREPAFSQGFDEVIGAKYQENIEEHQDCGSALTGAYLGEQA